MKNLIIENYIKEYQEELETLEKLIQEIKRYKFIPEESTYYYPNDFYNEIWKPIPNTTYKISNYGRIKNRQNQLRKVYFSKYGCQVDLSIKNKVIRYSVGRLVYYVFCNFKITKDYRIIHKDGKIYNNYFLNLQSVKKK